MCSAHFDCFYMCYSRLAVILDSKASKKYAKVGIFCMYPDSRLRRECSGCCTWSVLPRCATWISCTLPHTNNNPTNLLVHTPESCSALEGFLKTYMTLPYGLDGVGLGRLSALCSQNRGN